jgi:MFS superfamily sulfate permease-like transporter
MKNESNKIAIDWDPEEKILLLRTPGNFSKIEAEEIRKQIIDAFGQLNEKEKIKIIVDASGANKTDFEARRIYTDIATKFKGRVGKLAFIKAGVFTKLVAKFVLAVANKEQDTKFFNSFDEGLKWIKRK